MSITQPKLPCSGVIVSGGLSTRMGGRNKTLLKLGHQTILQRIIGTLQPVFENLLLVTRQPHLYQDYPVQVVTDIYPARSSLTGIHAGLVHATTDYSFVTACDAPFLKPALIARLLAAVEPDTDLVVPQLKQHYEPLCAIYKRTCIPWMEEQLTRQDFQIFRFFEKVKVKLLTLEEVREVDPQLHSFFNINTPESLALAESLLASGM